MKAFFAALAFFVINREGAVKTIRSYPFFYQTSGKEKIMQSSATYQAVPQPAAGPTSWTSRAAYCLPRSSSWGAPTSSIGHTVQTVQMMQPYGVPLAELLVLSFWHRRSCRRPWAGGGLPGENRRAAARALHRRRHAHLPRVLGGAGGTVVAPDALLHEERRHLGGLLHGVAHGTGRFAPKRG